LVNGTNCNVERKYKHSQASINISDISIRDGQSIISVGYDKTINCHSLVANEQERKDKSWAHKFPNLFVFTAFKRVKPGRDDEFLIGTGDGNIYHWKFTD
jgi:hypothetical protein